MALEAAAWSAGAVDMPEEELFEVRRGEGDLWELDLSAFVRWIVNQKRQGGKRRGRRPWVRRGGSRARLGDGQGRGREETRCRQGSFIGFWPKVG